MSNNNQDNPQFGRLLLALLSAVLFCVVLTFVMSTYFPDF